MNDLAAKNLVKTTFENPYSRDRFLILAKNIFKSFDEGKAFHARGYVKEKFKKTTPVVKTYERFGTFTDKDNNKIDILAVYLEKDKSLDRARTAQRNFVADYLKQRDSKDAALVAFVPPTLGNWRLSLVKMDYTLGKSKAGKIKAITELTPARRFSFSVGKEENTHTAQRQLLPVLKKDDQPPTLSDLEEAFSVEVVTKDFFEKYKTLFLNAKEALEKIVAKDTKIKSDFAEKNIDTVDFTKKLLGQIVFLYFLQKKGWFGVARDENWGTGPKDFLRRLFEKQLAGYDNFFNDILEPLFYEALAIERPDDFYSKFNCKIPFLNGGLFDPLGNYDWIHTDIRLNDILFSNSTKTKEGDIGNGILDVFDRYNFTVKEDEPLEREVAVDPEMLGKVFENLLEVKDRKSKGAYYTPREIVHYMCQESLVNYLTTETDGKVKRDEIETLIHLGETAVEHDSRVVAHGEETEAYKFKLPKSVRENASLIDESLEKIKACDPAVGSGAFLVGMMTEVIRARNTLSSYLPKNDRSIYAFKRHAIQNCLYGVDIDPGAVEIAKLRLWLSLVVDEQERENIQPLPNLDYKIMQGNSLLEEYEGIKLFNEGIVSASPFDNTKQIEEIKQKQSELQREFFKLHSSGELKGSKKQQIEAELTKQNDLLNKLTKAPKVKPDNGSLFDQMSLAKQKADELKKLHQEFFEAAHKNRKDEIKKEIEALEWDLIETTLREQDKQSLLPEIEHFKKANIKPFFLWKLNFSDVFEKNGGFDVVIANPPWVVLRHKEIGESLVKHLKLKYAGAGGFKLNLFPLFVELSLDLIKKNGISTLIIPNRLLDTPSYRGVREKFVGKYRVLDIENLPSGGFDEIVAGNIVLIIQKTKNDLKNIKVRNFYNEQILEIPIDDILSNSNLTININLNPVARPIIKKIKSRNNLKLKEICNIHVGMMIKNKKQKFTDNPTHKYQIVTGKELSRHTVSKRRYFDLEDVEIFGGTKRPSKHQESPKLLVRKTGNIILCSIDENGTFAEQSVYLVLLRNKNFSIEFLDGFLNSKLVTFYFQNELITNPESYPYLQHYDLENILVPALRVKEQKLISKLVKKILTITKDKNYRGNPSKQTKRVEYEKRIDQLVYKLYGLTPEEIRIIEGES